MKYNNNDLSSLLTVEEVRRQLLPQTRNVFQRIPGRDGEQHIRADLGPRTIEVDVRLIEDDRETVQSQVRALAGLLFSRTPAKLELEEEGMYEVAILSGPVDVEKFLYTGFATLVFIAPDPAAWSSTETTVNITAADITNVGTYPARGTITVTLNEAVSSLTVTLTTTGDRVHIDHGFVKNDVVVVDLDTETVTKNGVSVMKDVTLDSDFFELPVGKFKITVSAGTGVLKYRARWV